MNVRVHNYINAVLLQQHIQQHISQTPHDVKYNTLTTKYKATYILGLKDKLQTQFNQEVASLSLPPHRSNDLNNAAEKTSVAQTPSMPEYPDQNRI
jgi:hypothetical protein